MNERIKELAEQASADLDPEDFMGVSEEFLELFAELIAGACAELCCEIDGGENMFARAIRREFGAE